MCPAYDTSHIHTGGSDLSFYGKILDDGAGADVAEQADLIGALAVFTVDVHLDGVVVALEDTVEGELGVGRYIVADRLDHCFGDIGFEGNEFSGVGLAKVDLL